MTRIAIVGGGLSGLATAFYVMKESQRVGLKVDLSVYEAGSRLGGKIATVSTKGYRCETGPNGFLDNTPETLELIELLGIDDRLQRSSDAARRRFIYSGKKLRQLPESPLAFFGSSLLTVGGRLRIAGEFFVPKKKPGRPDEDETVAEFIRRRLGEEALQKLIDPMASGIHAGNPEKMSMASCFPRVVALEEQYGGLIKGMLGKQREARATGKKGPGGAGPGGTLMSFQNGLREIIDALSTQIAYRIKISTAAVSLNSRKEGSRSIFELGLESGDKVAAEAVILASPASAASQIVAGLDPEASELLRKIPYSTVSVVHFGYDRDEVTQDMNGFGFLVPHREKIRILGSLWSSSIFSNRAPSGKVLMTTMVGGARNAQTAQLRDGDLASVVKAELQRTIQQSSPPDFTLITRWPQAIPQYRPGHGKLLAAIEGRLSAHPGVFLVGNAYRGIGFNDCVKAACALAPRVVEHLRHAS